MYRKFSRGENNDSCITLLINGILFFFKGENKHNHSLCFTDTEIEVRYFTNSAENRNWNIIKCHFYSIMHHKSRIKKLMFTAQLNKLGIIKTYNRLDVLFVPIKSSFLCAISTCRKRLNCMLLSDLIVLFKNVLFNSSFLLKKPFAFKNQTKRGFGVGFFGS